MKCVPQVRLAELVEKVSTRRPDKEKPGQTFKYIDLSAVDQETKRIRTATTLECRSAPSRARQILHANDVLVSTVRPNLNGVAFVTAQYQQAIASTGFCVLRPIAEKLVSRYLFHWVKSEPFVKDMVRKATGASYPAVSDKIILASNIPLPPVSEQCRIANILDKADLLRVKRQETIAQLNRLAQAIFIEMFGDPIGNSKSFPISTLNRLCHKIQIGPFGSQLHESDYISDGIPLINPVHIRNGTITPDFELTLSKGKFTSLPQYHLRSGDVIMARRGEMGRCAVVTKTEDNWFCGTGSLFLRPDEEKITTQYLASFLSSKAIKNYLERSAQGVTMPNLNKNIVRCIPVPLPSLRNQIIFGERVRAIEHIKSSMQESMAMQAHAFNAIQHRAFQGEL